MAAMRTTALLAVLALSCASEAESPSDRYELDPQHLTVGFLVEHVGFAKVFGMFRESVGAFTFDEETGEISDVRVVVQTKQLRGGIGIDSDDTGLGSQAGAIPGRPRIDAEEGQDSTLVCAIPILEPTLRGRGFSGKSAASRFTPSMTMKTPHPRLSPSSHQKSAPLSEKVGRSSSNASIKSIL